MGGAGTPPLRACAAALDVCFVLFCFVLFFLPMISVPPRDAPPTPHVREGGRRARPEEARTVNYVELSSHAQPLSVAVEMSSIDRKQKKERNDPLTSGPLTFRRAPLPPPTLPPPP